VIFVDTGAWFATVVPSDANHVAAKAWLSQNPEPLLTTDYVIDETLTLLRARKESVRATVVGDQFFNGNLAAVYFLSENDVREAWGIFRAFSDKEWSFTDCTSKLVLGKLSIRTAFTFDQHFRQFGTVLVVP
jgi:predicted nucleic acid-binding protein